MTRTHFEQIADDIGLFIRRNPEEEHVIFDQLVPLLSTTFVKANPAFKKMKFIERIERTMADGLS